MSAPGFRITDGGGSDCRIDLQMGEAPGTFYRQEYGDQPAGGDPR